MGFIGKVLTNYVVVPVVVYGLQALAKRTDNELDDKIVQTVKDLL